ncbi:MAG: glutamate--tRNA ligase [Candidatus Yanofskybacteria bacterium RIFCSPHIGHO2_01_FULL_41_27]|uniref:Glutamate--tRNA ligase n=3 Tax=Candidatus Yanofskyibacteriota TaxID=1752733 RepID=A0A1F8HVM4_9BACT|nr:MAG: Glutamate-tRNA ligase [Candidatus Yanofskybacteria bacterium GW2011_GWC2_41_9]OGN00039.1 MAG: glutamate--tRNA ligase [Candidatus Yanofskybacteria bacterium RIFCSPHIGHO2_01_FULL_41_27]OGN09980.1 MAG: glutamate--tRNA ligase [Candidatus Yanofskybacteria bacterium RIFCSPHIGHO2_02_FULL_41_12]OGN21342.1 MAG: glutamate--tRNA ligase [Candidatus Yanofskybacteria bacterium RIFCSPLOWO2_01_FULL_41_33]OGN41627.1 MAG: glutamate--tRNA ligase [Candidatus Yanofskybacteria bacterium RIFOXYD1_FULL_42_10]
MEKQGKIRVRIAPSPTGSLHIGTARTALFNWLFARKNGGEFILRIEDTDLERSDKKYEENIIEGLKWLGINWDGLIYHQSERLDVYEKYLKQLLDSGKAFWCYHTAEELEAEKTVQMKRKEPPRHICGYKTQNSIRSIRQLAEADKTQNQEKGIIRLAVDENSTRVVHFNDAIRGQIEWEEKLIGDFSLAKDLRTPLYNFAVVVDDTDMEITHVIRGEDHISNTPKQILIYEALGRELPVFAHLPLILGNDKSKLSKRHGATSVMEYKKDYLPEALINFMGFLGFTYDKEIINKEEMAEEFDLAKVHKSGAVFDVKKLNWLNSQYIKRLAPSEFKNLTDLKVSDAVIPLITERLEKLSDVNNFEYFWKTPEYDKELLIWKGFSLDKIKESLELTLNTFGQREWIQQEALRKYLDAEAEQLGDRGLIYWPLRAALTGQEKSPDPVEIAAVLGKDEVIKRINTAIDKLSV